MTPPRRDLRGVTEALRQLGHRSRQPRRKDFAAMSRSTGRPVVELLEDRCLPHGGMMTPTLPLAEPSSDRTETRSSDSGGGKDIEHDTLESGSHHGPSGSGRDDDSTSSDGSQSGPSPDSGPSAQSGGEDGSHS